MTAVSEVEGTSMHLRLGFVVSLVILLSMMALRESTLKG